MNKDKKMEIEEIQIRPTNPKDGIIGFASCVINKELYISNIAIATRLSGGYRLIYPIKNILGKNLSIFYPINQSTGMKLEHAIVAKLRELEKKGERHGTS